MEEVKLENITLNFIARTVDDPKLLEEVFEENNRLIKENKELVKTLELRKQKIVELEFQPPMRDEPGSKVLSPKAKKTMNEFEEKEVNQVEDDISDLQRLADLKLSGHKRDSPQMQSKVQPKVKENQQTNKFICNKCGLGHHSTEDLEEHMDIHYEDGGFACDTCLFQTNKMRLLRKHLTSSPGHISGQVQGKATLKCGLCEDKFLNKKDLGAHKDRKHTTYKPCRYFKEGKCKQSPCRFNHKVIKEGNCVCFDCGKDFSDKNAMYEHRKKVHESTEICKKFLKQECDREETDCWFLHVLPVKKNPTPKPILKDTLHDHNDQGFWEVPKNLVPPIPGLNTDSLMKSIEEQVLKTMKMFMERINVRT